MLRRRRTTVLLTVGVLVGCVAAVAGAAPSGADIALNIGAAQTKERPTLIPSGQTATIKSKNFYVFLDLSLNSPVAGSAKARVELGGGLTWGADAPDPSEKCTSTGTAGECDAGDLQPIAGGNASGWYWDVVAPGNGTYTFKGAIVSTREADPDASNDSSQITIVVDDTTGGGGSGGGGSGGGGSGGGGSTPAKVSAGAVKLSPAKPRAGSTLVASVRVTRGGSALRPAAVTCVAALGTVKVRGGAKSASGVASCLFKTPKSAKGKSLAGSVSFRAGGSSFTRLFEVRLR